jgi:photosystem II stability/assembly factor-like uncharacterized protein
MKTFTLAFSIASLLIFSMYLIDNQYDTDFEKEETEKYFDEPNEHFFDQRTYPNQKFDLKGYEQALLQAANFDDGTFARGGTSWKTEGPFNIGGRVNAIAVQSNNSNVIYAGLATGGLWKTTDGGTTWKSIFDKQNYLAISDIEIDPNNTNIIYVATGDLNISGFPSIGDGLYKSTDAGATWKYIGLKETRIVSTIRVNPLNTNILYAGTMGVPFEKNADRGFYKSIDGGATWSKKLFVSDSTGVIDMVVNPQNPNILYVSTWDRIRNDRKSIVSGNGARIYKSTNGGDTWSQLTVGLPSGPQCRIGLAIYEANPNILYSSYVGTDLTYSAVYKTSNAGVKWDSIPLYSAGFKKNAVANFGWYFGKININPSNPDDIFVQGIDLWRKKNATSEWELATPDWWLYQVHGDKHDLVFTKDKKILVATDGGIYRSDDDCLTWKDIENIPCTEIYRVGENPHDIGTYWIGAQDNGTSSGNALSGDWPRIWGGDGFQMRFHPTDPSTFFVETQNGNISVTFDDGNEFQSAITGIDEKDRRNWDMQYLISPYDATTLYTGTYRVYKAKYSAIDQIKPTWTAISQDLTKGNLYGDRFHSISTIEESKKTKGLIYVGTTDGMVWRTQNDGVSWEKIMTGLPDRYVTKILPLDGNRVIVTFSGYRYNEFTPHIFESTDRGTTWKSISSNLPMIAINDVCLAEKNLVVATDAGTFISDGTKWYRLGDNMPALKVLSVIYSSKEKKILAGTYGRSLMTIDYAAPTSTNENELQNVKIYPTLLENNLNIESLEEKISKIEIFDLNGRNVFSEKGIFNQKTIEINHLQKGTYLVRLTSDKKTMVKKVMKI